MSKLALWVCNRTDIPQKQLLSKARGGRLSEAKSVLCYLGSTELGLTLREISDYLAISQPSVSAWIKKGESLCKKKGIRLVVENP